LEKNASIVMIWFRPNKKIKINKEINKKMSRFIQINNKEYFLK
jgi:hypothetical protein